jgi:hypothetical protein
MSALSLSAVGCSGWKGSIAFSADHLVASVASCKSSKGWFDLLGSTTTSSKSEDQMESGFLLNIVVRKGSSIFQLLSGKNEPLLIWGDTFLILDFSPKRSSFIPTSHSRWNH